MVGAVHTTVLVGYASWARKCRHSTAGSERAYSSKYMAPCDYFFLPFLNCPRAVLTGNYKSKPGQYWHFRAFNLLRYGTLPIRKMEQAAIYMPIPLSPVFQTGNKARRDRRARKYWPLTLQIWRTRKESFHSPICGVCFRLKFDWDGIRL